jgi:hypothetical protein
MRPRAVLSVKSTMKVRLVPLDDGAPMVPETETRTEVTLHPAVCCESPLERAFLSNPWYSPCTIQPEKTMQHFS